MLRAGLWHRGIQRQVIAPLPDQGKDWEIQVPTTPEGVWWEVISVVTAIVTSAVVANRQLRILFLPNLVAIGDRIGAAYAVIPTIGVVGAGTSRTYTAAQGCPAVSSSGDLTGLPIGLRLQPGHYITSLVSAMDVGDQVKIASLLIQEWIYEPAAERSPNVGDGSDRVDAIKLNKTLERIAQLLESQTATP